MRICFLGDAVNIHIKKRALIMAAKGHDVHIVSLRKNSIPNTQVHHIKPFHFMGKLNYIFRRKEFTRLIKKISPDIVDAHYLTSSGYIANYIEDFPVVATAWGSDVLVSTRRSKFLYRTVQNVCHKAYKVISVSKQITEELIKMGIRKDKIDTFPIGVDFSSFAQCKISKNKEFTIISTRWHEPIYNLELLINSIPLVLKNIPNAKFIIAGDGSQRHHLEKRADELGVSDRVEFIGRIEHSKLVESYCQSHIYVSTSLSDGSSESLFEAFAGGTFPIVTDIQANKGWISNDINGFLVPTDNSKILAEKIIQAYQVPKYMQQAREFNLNLANEKANLHINMDRLEGIYKQAIKEWRINNESAIS